MDPLTLGLLLIFIISAIGAVYAASSGGIRNPVAWLFAGVVLLALLLLLKAGPFK